MINEADEDGGHAAGEWLDRLNADQIALLNEMLMVGIRQVENAEFGDPDMEKLLAEGRTRRAKAIAAE